MPNHSKISLANNGNFAKRHSLTFIDREERLSQLIFAEKDIKQVSEALLQERKRVKELTHENEALCAQGQQLRAMLKMAGGENAKTLKAQFQEIEDLKKSLDKEKKQNAIYKCNNDILAGLIKDKEKKIHELEQFEYSARLAVSEKKEIDTALGGEVLRSRTLEKEVKEAKQTLENIQKANDEFSNLLAIANAKNKESTLKIQTLEKSVEEQNSANFELKELLSQADSKEKDYIAKIASLKENISTLENKLQIQDELHKKNQEQQKIAITNLYNEHLHLKQTVIQSMKEVNELKVQYLEAVKEKIGAIGQLQRVSKEVEKYAADAEDAKKKLHDLTSSYANKNKKAIEEFQEQRGILLGTIDKTQKDLQRVLQEKEVQKKELELFQEEIDNLTKANNELTILNETASIDLQKRIDANIENEEQLIAAKHHVAKKVKEVALLHEKIDQLREEAALQDEMQKEACQKLEELEQALEEQTQKEKEYSEKLIEYEQEKTLKEKQLQEAIEQCQRLQMQVQELKDIEIRHSELQKLLGGLGKVLSPQESVLQAISPKKYSPLLEDKIEESSKEKIKEEQSPQELQPKDKVLEMDAFSLFDRPKVEGQKSKNSLF